MAATLKDVANQAGVSTATVSYVLNNGPRPVSAKTRQRVLEAINQLGYQPRRKQKSSTSPSAGLTIGVIVPNSYSTFFGSAIEGIENFLYARGHSCIVASNWEDPAIEKQLIRKLSKLIDGLIITPASDQQQSLDRLQEQGIPIILMDRLGDVTHFNGVGINNYNITTQAVNLLFDSHYESIALINGPKTLAPIRQRLSGYQDSLKQLGLTYNPDWVLHVDFDEEAGRNATLDLMSSHSPPNAIICTGSDTSTVGILYGLKQLGLTLPNDVALVSYGDTNWLALLSPAITVIEAPTFLMGETSARVLLKTISNPNLAEARHIFLDTKPILRESHRRSRSTVRREDELLTL